MTTHDATVRAWHRKGTVKTFANYRAVCSCGWKSPWEVREDLAVQWVDEHVNGPSVEDVFAPSDEVQR